MLGGNMNEMKNILSEFNKYKIYDLSQVVYEGIHHHPIEPDTIIREYRTFKKDGLNMFKIDTGLHAGTHVDAPKHHLENGIGIDKIKIDKYIGLAKIFNTPKKSNCPIEIGDINAEEIRKDLIVIFYTGWNKYVGTSNYFNNPPFISKDLANYLVSKKIKAVGSDMPSVDSFTGVEPVSHRILLKNSIGIIEGLVNILKIINEKIFFIGLPIKIKDADGSFIRAIGIKI